MPPRGSQAGPLGQLPSGEAYFAPIGEMRSDGERMQCHLCGRWYKMLGGSHLLSAHGWTTAEYRDAFQLNLTASTVGPATGELKRDSMLEQIASGVRGFPLPNGGRPTPAAWRSLAAVHPQLVGEWHPTRNRKLEAAGISPRTVGARSTRTVWWRCQTCQHDWRTTVASRRDSGCPACYARHLHERSLAVLYPHLAAEWHAERNGDLDPNLLGASSERRVWWRCATCGRVWQAIVKKRTARSQGCPDCGRRKAAEFAARADRWRQPREASLGVLHPELVGEWHSDRNDGLDPFAVGTGSSLNVWWKCGKCGFEWQTRPSHRCEGSGCPRCAGRHVAPELSLAAVHPEWLADWHPDRNAGLDPTAIPPRSGRHWIWWRCQYCGHEWRTTPLGRGQSPGGCRSCSRRKAA
jgi:rubrerythrin